MKNFDKKNTGIDFSKSVARKHLNGEINSVEIIRGVPV